MEFPNCREDFKFRHILYPAIVYPTQINIPQMKRTRYETKNHNSRFAYKTSKLKMSRITVKVPVIASNTHMFCSRGAPRDVVVVSSSMRSKTLKAERLKAWEKQSISSDAVNISVDKSCNTIGSSKGGPDRS